MISAINSGAINNQDNYALPKIPDEVTLIILKNLENLMDVRSFASSSHQASISAQPIWFYWAKKFEFKGSQEESATFLAQFFSKVARVANNYLFYHPLRGANGYLTAMNILDASSHTIQSLLHEEWAFQHEEMLTLIKLSTGATFIELLSSHPKPKKILTYAAKYGHIDIIEGLCSKNLKLAGSGYKPLKAATEAGQAGSIKALASYGANLDVMWDQVQKISMHHHIIKGITIHSSCHMLLPMSPLYLACESGNSKTVISLLQSGVYSENEFIQRCMKADLCILKIFLEFTIQNVTGGLSLCLSASKLDQNTFACMELLLKKGAKPDICNIKGKPYLHHFIKKGEVDFVRLLCSNGANLNLRDRKNKAPLYVAIKSAPKPKRLAITRILLQHRADPLAQGPKGEKTLFEHAANNKELFTLLKSFQLKNNNIPEK